MKCFIIKKLEGKFIKKYEERIGRVSLYNINTK